MKSRLKLIQFFLVILLSIFIPLVSTFHDYSDLADIDFPSRDRSFENPEKVDLLVAQRDEPRLFVPGFFSVALRQGIDPLESFLRLTFQMASSNQETIVLRC